MHPILVTGATGRIGRAVVAELLAAGVPVRALTRRPDADGLPAAVEVVAGDFTVAESLDAVLEGVRAGARGYLLKDVSLEQLTEAIRTIAAGGSLIRPAVTERVLRGLEHIRRDFDALSPPDPLTKREVEILRLMAGGYSNREIATALGTAEGTVKNHASSILSKLGVRDRTRAVLKALELGYI